MTRKLAVSVLALGVVAAAGWLLVVRGHGQATPAKRTEVRSAAVPVLLLQPLVENAIRHGLAERVASGRIEITARRRGDRLVIKVTDDGSGPERAGASRRERVGLGGLVLDLVQGSFYPVEVAEQ